MFKQDDSLTYIDATGRQVHSLHSSINQPQVALGSHPVAACVAFICSIWTRDRSLLETVIMLYQQSTGAALFYIYEGGLVPPDRHANAEDEALQYCETMGFMMDRINLEAMNPDQLHKTLDDLPLFTPRAAVEEVSEASFAIPDDIVELDAEAEVIMSDELSSSPPGMEFLGYQQEPSIADSQGDPSGLQSSAKSATSSAGGSKEHRAALAKLMAAF